MLSREEVVWAFKYVLGRNPESGEDIERLCKMADYKALRDHLMRAPEFLSRLTITLKPVVDHPYRSFDRKTVAFIHIQKTAGTTLTRLLHAHFEVSRRCPERFNHLHLYCPAELAKYDFYSGHFDFFGTQFIPRRNVFRISILRDPRERLISFYRFARAHAPSPTILADPLFKLAKELDAADYFQHEGIRKSYLINNHYRAVFSGSLWPHASSVCECKNPFEGDLHTAIDNVRRLEGLGLTDRFRESVVAIFKALKFPIPADIGRQMASDQMHVADAEVQRVPPIEITPRLEDALAELVAYDDLIFSTAVSEFDRRNTQEAALA